MRHRVPTRPLLIAAAALAAIGVAVTVAITVIPDDKPKAPKTFTISGTMEVIDIGIFSDTGTDGEACTLPDGYSDIPGAQVVVTDASSRVIALGNLPATGRMSSIPPRHCVFNFSLDVPEGHDFYGVEVAHRGRVQYTRDKLYTPITLTLGD